MSAKCHCAFRDRYELQESISVSKNSDLTNGMNYHSVLPQDHVTVNVILHFILTVFLEMIVLATYGTEFFDDK